MRSLSPVIRLKLPGLTGQLPRQPGRNEAAKAAALLVIRAELSRHDPLQDNIIISNALLWWCKPLISARVLACKERSKDSQRQGSPPRNKGCQDRARCAACTNAEEFRGIEMSWPPKYVSESVPNPDPLGLIMHALLRVLSGFLPAPHHFLSLLFCPASVNKENHHIIDHPAACVVFTIHTYHLLHGYSSRCSHQPFPPSALRCVLHPPRHRRLHRPTRWPAAASAWL